MRNNSVRIKMTKNFLQHTQIMKLEPLSGLTGFNKILHDLPAIGHPSN